MNELLDAAPWIALATGVLAAATAVLLGLRTWRRIKVLDQTQQAATALLDVHMGRIDDSISIAGEAAGTLADGGEQLAESLSELRADAEHLRWLVERPGEERSRLKRAVLDLMLPTNAAGKDAGREHA